MIDDILVQTIQEEWSMHRTMLIFTYLPFKPKYLWSIFLKLVLSECLTRGMEYELYYVNFYLLAFQTQIYLWSIFLKLVLSECLHGL
jgi:hypothetical protein